MILSRMYSKQSTALEQVVACALVTQRARVRSPVGTGFLGVVFSGFIDIGHGCARLPHCVTARWRNFSHYCRPLRHYDVWLRVLITEKHWQPRRQHTVYRNKSLEFATEQVGRVRYVTAVDGGLKRFPSAAWFAHPCHRGYQWFKNIPRKKKTKELTHITLVAIDDHHYARWGDAFW